MTTTAPPPVAKSLLDMIGNTPLLACTKLNVGCCELFLKLENQNPGGSIKDRIGRSMIEAAEREGQIGPGSTIVEATAGNTGLGLALVAAQKGYRMILVIPDKMSQEKVFHLKALGASVVMTRSDVGSRPSAILSGPGRHDRPRNAKGVSTSTSSTTPRIRWPTKRPLPRRFGSRPSIGSTRWFAASVRGERSRG